VPGETPGTVAATLSLTNRHSSPLQLSNGDITLTANNRPITLPDLPELHQPIAPGEQRRVRISAPLGDHETVILTVGVARFALERSEGR